MLVLLIDVLICAAIVYYSISGCLSFFGKETKTGKVQLLAYPDVLNDDQKAKPRNICNRCSTPHRLIAAYPSGANQWKFLCSKCLQCQRCHQVFRSRNELFRHFYNYPFHSK